MKVSSIDVFVLSYSFLNNNKITSIKSGTLSNL